MTRIAPAPILPTLTCCGAATPAGVHSSAGLLGEFNPVISTTTNPAPSPHPSCGHMASFAPFSVGVDKDRDLTPLRAAVDSAQALYDDTRSHEHLVRLKDAKHALLAAEVGL